MWILYTNKKGYLCSVPETQAGLTVEQIRQTYPPIKYFYAYLKVEQSLRLLQDDYIIQKDDMVIFDRNRA